MTYRRGGCRGLCRQVGPCPHLTELHTRAAQGPWGMITHPSLLIHRCLKTLLPSVRCASGIPKASTHHLEPGITPHRLFHILPYLTGPDEKAVPGLNHFILRDHVKFRGHEHCGIISLRNITGAEDTQTSRGPHSGIPGAGWAGQCSRGRGTPQPRCHPRHLPKGALLSGAALTIQWLCRNRRNGVNKLEQC